MRDGALLCTPDAASDRILEYVASGADEVNIALRAPWDDAALDVYLEEVQAVSSDHDETVTGRKNPESFSRGYWYPH